MNDDELLDALGDALEPPDRPVPEAGLRAVRAQAAAAGTAAASAEDPGTTSRRTVLVGTVAAAVGAVAGVAGAVAVGSTGNDGDGGDDAAAPPTRPVEFGAVPTGTTVAARTIDHTWGMELLLDVSGLPVDRDYAVAYATTDGSVSAGGFRSVAKPMACRFNGTVLRSEVTEIEIVDQGSGEVVLRGRPV